MLKLQKEIYNYHLEESRDHFAGLNVKEWLICCHAHLFYARIYPDIHTLEAENMCVYLAQIRSLALVILTLLLV